MNINISINTNKNQLSLTPLEIASNKLFAVLLALSTLMYFLNIFTLPTIIIYIVFVFFLWFGKKYRLFANIIFLIFAIGVYFIPITPIGWGLFRMLKELRLGDVDFNFALIFYLAALIFISFSVRNVLGNIFAYFKTSTASRNVYYFISLVIVLATLLAYPFLDSVKLRDQSFPAQGTGDLSTIVIRQTLTFIDRYHKEDGFTSRFDSSTKKYVYRLRLLEPLNKDLQFTKVETDGEKINFTTDNRVKCLNCQKDMGNPYGLVFPAGKDIDFIISSDQLIRTINFTEQENKLAEFVFWK
ncbi:MAG: hypothetical protein NTZ93_03190 [Candidatus Beckwithbacteria bacterium]|nr:hypothetical protein [Candidatus Beckwithbacteria bacterium]